MSEKDFSRKVVNIVSKIPRGQTMTYAQVARTAGSPQACRAVGNVLNRSYRERNWQLLAGVTEPIPCHRVIRSDGKIGGYAKGAKAKEKMLKAEGHKIEKMKIVTPKIKTTQVKLGLKKKKARKV